jgi:ATP-binding cassette subfamily B protein
MPKLQSAFMLTDKGYRDLKKAVAACVLTNISMMLPVGVALRMIMEIIKPLMGGEVSWNTMWLLFGAGLIAAALVFLCNRRDYTKTYVACYTESENTRTAIAEHIRKLPMSLFNSKDLTELTTNFMGDVSTSEHVQSHVLPQLLANFISVTAICVMLTFFDWRMSLAAFITVPLSFGIIYLARRIMARLGEKLTDAKLTASGQVQEYIEGIKVIRACNLDGEKFTALENALLTMKKMSISTELIAGVFVMGAQVILQAGIGLTVLLGVTLLTGGQIDLISLLTFLLIVVRIYGPFLVELVLLPELIYHRIAVNRMRSLMAVAPMSGDAEKRIPDTEIRFENVSFKYNRDGESAIRNLSLTIPAGSVTALVGPSGSGKSTVSRLAARFWDANEGKITIGGVDVKTLDPEHLMSYMSFVFQDVVLFNDTIYNNIRIGNMDATSEQILAAARAACCDEFAGKLPDGFDTLLGENGSTLSGGERQRISIARALLKDAPIVLLDEATASLDPENESLIQRAISALIKGKTVIVIAHRLRTVMGADKIAVLDNGRLAEEGTGDELLKKGGLFARLHGIQQESHGWTVA